MSAPVAAVVPLFGNRARSECQSGSSAALQVGRSVLSVEVGRATVAPTVVVEDE